MAPSILFIMSDDHAAHAISAFGSVINETPNIDRIVRNGVLMRNCFCTNAICAPSRGVILTGVHSHINGVRTLDDRFDGRQETVARLLQAGGYQTALFGKWHLGHGGNSDPTGFDTWTILPDQGEYHNPEFYVNGNLQGFTGYVTDLITDFGLQWLEERDRDKPFFMMMHHKAPHRNWQPDTKHARLYEDQEIPYPVNFDDDFEGRSDAAMRAWMRMEHLTDSDTKGPPPDGLTPNEERRWKYQRFIKDYLRCVASIDDNIGKVLDYLQDEGLLDNTIVMYTSDQGFFLGDHGWFDKRFMYEESLRMPLLMMYPAEIPAGQHVDTFITNLDFAPTWLDYAGLRTSVRMQGRSFRNVVAGDDVSAGAWPDEVYYRYWMDADPQHNATAHYGIRTREYKLIHYYGSSLGSMGNADPVDTEWELFDLTSDPHEMRNVYHDPAYASVVASLTADLARVQREAGDTP